MNSQEALQEALATTRNEALAHAWSVAAQYRASALMEKSRADALQAELDKLKDKPPLSVVPDAA